MGRGDFNLDDYKTVPERIVEFAAKHPDGCLRPVNPNQPYRIETVGDTTFVVYAAAAYRSETDPLPGIGVAWERVPGTTTFTKDSELQNAETSAWGRAIVAVLASDTKKGIASAEDVRSRENFSVLAAITCQKLTRRASCKVRGSVAPVT